ncbi:sensor histidine kinase [Pontibacter chitinilyticus]|uniref:sensor histidine kinase n=1 Tax=Pontibacter chitinilyticus TaxID=2674989 RepID=UPI00321A10EF
MAYRNFKARLLLRLLLLGLSLSLPAVLLLHNWAEALVFLLPLLAYQGMELFRFVAQAQEELEQFVESVHYRDFTRHFDEKHATTDVQLLRKGFNEISSALKNINREKEAQHLQLQRILELVETGILSYNTETGEVLLMNESLKKLLQLPFMHTIQALVKRDEELYAAVVQLLPGQNKVATVHTLLLERHSIKVLLSATAYQSEGNSYKLVAFQNVNEALDETESQAWQKLLNVMTHEIMNSVAPISSLADTLKHRLQQTMRNGAAPGDAEDLEEGITTIRRRSEGLLKFATTYRNLSKITKLHVETIALQETFTNLQRLMEPTLAQKGIRLETILKDPQLTLRADPNLLDQVLINLLVNAMEAVKNSPEPTIVVSAYPAADGKVLLKILDNGSGMPADVQEKIFIPFFSTRKNGTGIGLSLCKQIVLLHRGTIQVQSEEGVGTAFILQFR